MISQPGMVRVWTGQPRTRHPGHNTCYIVTLILMWIAALFTYFLTVATFLPEIGLFEANFMGDSDIRNPAQNENPGTDTEDNEDKPEVNDSNIFNEKTMLDPAGWVFFVTWFLIFSYELVFLCYITSTVFRRSPVTDQPLYKVTPFIQAPAIIFYSVSIALLGAWYFVVEAQSRIGGILTLVACLITLIVTYGLLINGIYTNYPALNAAGFKNEDRLVVGIGINSVGLLLTWIAIATHVSVASILVAEAKLEPEVAAALPLTTLIIIYGIYIFLDLGFLEKYFRFLYAPHLPFVFGLTGIVMDNFDAKSPLTPLLVGFLVVILAVVPIKLTLDITRERKRPRFGDARIMNEGQSKVNPASTVPYVMNYPVNNVQAMNTMQPIFLYK